MKRFIVGFVCGLIVGLGAGVALLLFILPGPPSAYKPRFPIVSEGLPKEALAHLSQRELGFDIYTNPKAKAVLKKATQLPTRKTTAWETSSGHDGTLLQRESIWAEYDGKLYEVGHFEKKYSTQPNRFMSMMKIYTVDAARSLSVRILIPDIEVDETFGPCVIR